MDETTLTASQAYLSTVQNLILVGKHRMGRLGGMREMLGYTVRVAQSGTVRGLYDLEHRRLNPTIGALESLQLLGQVSLPEVHTDRVKVFENYLDGGVFLGAYGQRIYGQLERLVKTLAAPGSRQAVLTIYDSRTDLDADSRDIPCTLSLQFFIRDDTVILRTSMRSNDVWLGLPYDLHQFINLQAAVAAHFDLPVGWYQHTVGSMHLYDRDYDKALAFVQKTQGQLEFEDDETLYEPHSVHDLSSWARRSLVNGGPVMLHETNYQTWVRESLSPHTQRTVR